MYLQNIFNKQSLSYIYLQGKHLNKHLHCVKKMRRSGILQQDLTQLAAGGTSEHYISGKDGAYNFFG